MEGYVIEGELANIFNLPQKTGILVQRIAPGSPAEWIGLQGGMTPAQMGDEKFFVGGDIILGVNGISVAEENSYTRMRHSLTIMKDGTNMTVKVLRAGIIRDLVKTYHR
jgi:S1-C subfamily serine protease